MILFSQGKKKALLLFFTIFSGGISGLGALQGKEFSVDWVANQEKQEEVKNVHSSVESKKMGARILKNIFKDSNVLTIFEKPQDLSGSEEELGYTVKSFEEGEVISEIKKKIFEKIAQRVKNRKIVGQFIYKLVTDTFLLVIVRFR